jgi:hypothetical protein
MFKQIIRAVIFISLFTSCQSEKPTSDNSVTDQNVTVQTTPQERQDLVTEASDQRTEYCYVLSDRGNRQEIKLIVDGEKMTGYYHINSKEKIQGKLSGFFRNGDIIADFDYEMNGKKYEEKIIITRELNSARVARSGTIKVEGKLGERNGGTATLETLQQQDCD